MLVTDHTKSDSKQLPNLLEKLGEHFKIDNVLADMGYLSNDNIKAIVEAGAAAYIPFKRNATGKGSARGGEMYNQQYHRFMADPETYMARYHERSKIEAIFGAIKQKYGEKLWSKTEVAQQNEILCKVLAHNINTLNLDMQRNSSTPAFSGQILVMPQPAMCEMSEGRRFYKARGKYAAPSLRAVIAQ